MNSPPIHGGNIIEEARHRGIRPDEILDASASIVPFKQPKALNDSLIKLIHNNSIRNYPDCTHQSLKEAISDWHGVDSSMVIPGNGASELFTWAARNAADLGVSGLPTPGFHDYKRALQCWNAHFINLPLPLRWTSKSPQPFPLLPKTNVIWITNPHNPTGQLWTKDSIKLLLATHELVICDEVFLPLVPDGESQSLLPLVSNHSNLIVIRSFTKLFPIAGLRLGYAIGTPARLSEWGKWRDPWPINGLAIEAGTLLMSNKVMLNNWLTKIQSWVSKEGAWIFEELKCIKGIIPHPSSANFLLIESDHQESLIPLREKLVEQKILLRDCRSFPELGASYLRLSLQTRQGNRRIISALKKILK